MSVVLERPIVSLAAIVLTAGMCLHSLIYAAERRFFVSQSAHWLAAVKSTFSLWAFPPHLPSSLPQFLATLSIESSIFSSFLLCGV